MYKHKYWEKSESYRKEEKKCMCQERTLFPTSTQEKWERKIQVKLNPSFRRESDHLFFFYPWKALAKKKEKKRRRSKSAKNLLSGRILRIFVCLLSNCFFWKQKNVRFYFGRATLSWCIPLVIKLPDNLWGYSCFLKNLWYCPWQVGVRCAISGPGRAAGRRISLLSSERQGEQFLPLLAAPRGWFFFFLFNSQWGDLHIKVHSIYFFFQTNRFCMSNVQLWQYEKPHLFKRHWYIKHIYWNPNLRFLKQMCRKKYLQRMAIKRKIKTFKVKITMNFPVIVNIFLIIAFRMINCIINYEVLSLKK